MGLSAFAVPAFAFRAGRGLWVWRFGAVLDFRRFAKKSRLTVWGLVSYIGFIDGGAAGERAAGDRRFPSLVLEVSARQGLPGVLSSSGLGGVPLGLRPGMAVVLSLCCLTIVSEERETWAAVSLRSAFGRTWRFMALREMYRRSRFQIHRVGWSLGWLTDVFGTRREGQLFGGLALIVTCRVQVLSYNLRV